MAINQNDKEDINVIKFYGKEATLSKKDFLATFKINEKGLSNSVATRKLNKYGNNEIKQAKPKKWYNYFFASLFTPFNLILIGIAFILYYTDVYISSNPNYTSILVVVTLVLVSTFLDFFQEYRSNKAAEKLKELVATTVTVVRSGKEISMPIKNIVLGDVVILSAR